MERTKLDDMQRIVLAWPYLEEEWYGVLEEARREWLMLARTISETAPIEVLVRDAKSEAWLRTKLPAAAQLTRIAYADAWVRDTAPWVVASPNESAAHALCARFNGWGGKFDLDDDRELNLRLADVWGLDAVRLDIIGEGGGIEYAPGRPLLLTESAWLGKTRNQDRDLVASILLDTLPIKEVRWFTGGLDHDHTDGHIDNALRWSDSGQLVIPEAKTPDDPQHAALRRLREEAEAAFGPEALWPVPTPGTLRGTSKEILPASYVNFLAAGELLLVPTFGERSDAEALDRLRAVFPKRFALGLPARHLICAGGGFHCLTMEAPFA